MTTSLRLLPLVVVVVLVRKRGVSACGEPIVAISDYDLSETIKVFLLTSLSVGSPPIHVQMRTGCRANGQFDFLLFVIDCIRSGLLVQGDVLVLDNASIHKEDGILQPLHTLVTLAGIILWFMPTYSPELNPCEFVFAQTKKWLKYHRRMHLPFWYECARGFSQTTIQHMHNYYNKAIWDP